MSRYDHKNWTDLRPGDRIRIGYQSEAADGTFVRLESREGHWLYGDTPTVAFINEYGREDAMVPHVGETARVYR